LIALLVSGLACATARAVQPASPSRASTIRAASMICRRLLSWFRFGAIRIYQLAGGKVTGSWAYQDSLGLVQQLRA
jgi:hypothetical protein